VDRILAAKKENMNADLSSLEQQVDQLITALYGILVDEKTK
jgi:hypothetical protein